MSFPTLNPLYTINLPKILSDPSTILSGEGQCDCACVTASPNQVVSTPKPMSGVYQLAFPLNLFPLSDTYFIGAHPQIPPFVLNLPALTFAEYFQTPHTIEDAIDDWTPYWGDGLASSMIEQMSALGLLIPENRTLSSLVETSHQLTAWLHLTDRCNLRCAYCYLPHKREDMSLEIGRAAIDATFRSALLHNYAHVKLKYAGGEPLLRFPLLVELHQYAQSLAQKFNLVLDGVILSNSTLLTLSMIETILSLGLKVMISLDGLGDLHDSQRFYADGRGTFNEVAQGVDMALQAGLIPDISVTVSGRNAHGLPELMAWLLDRDLPFSLNFYRENELSCVHTDLNLEEDQIIKGMLAAFKEIEHQLPRQSLLASLIDRANLSTPHLRTCGVGNNYMVFDHKGEISKCQMQRFKPVTSVQAQDPLELIRLDQSGIQNLSVAEKEGCRDCEWKYWCTGGCSLATFRTTGRYDIKSPNCRIYKTLFPEAVRLEGLRLLKYFGNFD